MYIRTVRPQLTFTFGTFDSLGCLRPFFLEILETKVVQFWCYTKLIKTQKLSLSWYSSDFFFERFKGFLMLKIDFENQILALFDIYFWPFNKSHEKINAIFVISATMASIWNVFIKFRWHDEKLITGINEYFLKLHKRLAFVSK